MKSKIRYQAPVCKCIYAESVIMNPTSWTMSTTTGGTDVIHIIEGDPTGEIDAKQNHFSAWGEWDEDNNSDRPQDW